MESDRDEMLDRRRIGETQAETTPAGAPTSEEVECALAILRAAVFETTNGRKRANLHDALIALADGLLAG